MGGRAYIDEAGLGNIARLSPADAEKCLPLKNFGENTVTFSAHVVGVKNGGGEIGGEGCEDLTQGSDRAG